MNQISGALIVSRNKKSIGSLSTVKVEEIPRITPNPEYAMKDDSRAVVSVGLRPQRAVKTKKKKKKIE